MRHEAELKVVLFGVAAVGLLLLPTPAQAQRYEVTGLIGYTTRGNIEKTARQITDLEIAGSFTLGNSESSLDRTWVGKFPGLPFGSARVRWTSSSSAVV